MRKIFIKFFISVPLVRDTKVSSCQRNLPGTLSRCSTEKVLLCNRKATSLNRRTVATILINAVSGEMSVTIRGEMVYLYEM